jgi:hypothetical protein
MSYAIEIDNCPLVKYKNMTFHACKGLKQYSEVKFYDITGENYIHIMPERLYHNHGIYTSMSKNNILYVGAAYYPNKQWVDALENI